MDICNIVPQIVACSKWQLEFWKNVGIEFHVEIIFVITNFDFYITIFIIFIIVCTRSSKQIPFSTYIKNHNIYTRQKINSTCPKKA